MVFWICMLADTWIHVKTSRRRFTRGVVNPIGSTTTTKMETFTDVTDRAGVGDTGLCLGTVWGDYDDDGYPDLYVVNDFGRKTLYHNNGNGTFTDVTVHSNMLDYGRV